MATTDFLPRREVDLLNWSAAFNKGIQPDPQSLGLSEEMAAQYAAVHAAYADSIRLVRGPHTRTPKAIVQKNGVKKALIASARELARIIQADPDVTPAQKSSLHLTVRKLEDTPIGPMTAPPQMFILSAEGTRVRLRLRDGQEPERRGKPAGVIGATLFTAVGRFPPLISDLSAWTFTGNHSRTRITVDFADRSVRSGTTVWFTAFWFTARMQPSPMMLPISTQIPGQLPAANADARQEVEAA
jgi:hypothetical protein